MSGVCFEFHCFRIEPWVSLSVEPGFTLDIYALNKKKNKVETERLEIKHL